MSTGRPCPMGEAQKHQDRLGVTPCMHHILSCSMFSLIGWVRGVVTSCWWWLMKPWTNGGIPCSRMGSCGEGLRYANCSSSSILASNHSGPIQFRTQDYFAGYCWVNQFQPTCFANPNESAARSKPAQQRGRKCDVLDLLADLAGPVPVVIMDLTKNLKKFLNFEYN